MADAVSQDDFHPGRYCLDLAYQYAEDVRDGKITVHRYVKLAVKRWFDDLETAGGRGYHFDENAASKAFCFIARYCRHSKGKWKGKAVVPSAWQCFIIANVFGWLDEKGNRRFRTVYQEVPRKNGKTTLLAAIALYGLIADGENGAEIYSAATKRDQAKILFDEAKRMISQSPELRRRLNVLRNNINHSGSFSKFEPLSAEAGNLDGLNIHFFLPDELHAHKTPEVWNVGKSGQGSREQPLNWTITTAGFNIDGICYQVRESAISMLEGIEGFENDSLFAIIYTANIKLDESDDSDIDEHGEPYDDPNDLETWKKANPNFGISVFENYIHDQWKSAKVVPSEWNNFLTKHLDVWVTSEAAWLTPETWNACKSSYDKESLVGLRCCGGLDLSANKDLTSLVLAFENGSKVRLFSRHYIPQEALKLRVQKNNVPYDKWVKAGWLIATPGNVVDQAFIEEDIKTWLSEFDIEAIGFDDWNSTRTVTNLLSEEAPMVNFRQGYKSMNPAIYEAERLILSNQLEHNGDPVLAWCIKNAVVKQDPAGSRKLDKSKSKEKIDAAVAMVMAIGLLMQDFEPPVDIDNFINNII